MSAPDLTPEQQDALIDGDYRRSLQLLTPQPERLVPLISQLRMELDGTEAGAPMSDTQMPLTGGAPWEAVSQALGTTQTQALVDGWLDLLPLVTLASHFGTITPGRYALRNVTPDRLLGILSGYGNFSPETFGFDADGLVVLTEPHIRLLRNVQWRWMHYEIAEGVLFSGTWPGPSIDPKRVYGNMSFIELDMHRILELPIEQRTEDGFVELTDTQLQELGSLHLTLLPVTQVFVENVSLDLARSDVGEALAQWAIWAAN